MSEEKRSNQLNSGFGYDSSVPSATHLRFSRSSDLRRGQSPTGSSPFFTLWGPNPMNSLQACNCKAIVKLLVLSRVVKLNLLVVCLTCIHKVVNVF